jgi:hypothetical protein
MVEIERRVRKLLGRSRHPHQLREGEMAFEKSLESFPDQCVLGIRSIPKFSILLIEFL